MGMKGNGNGNGAKPTLVPQPHGGALLTGGVPGHRGGGGRPSNALREQMRSLLAMAQDEVVRRLQDWETELRDPGFQRRLKRMTKAQLIEFINENLPQTPLSTRELKEIMDVAGKYGIGVKHEVSGVDDGPLRFGVFALPPLDLDEEDS